jgi:hypothetical protein
MMMLALMHFAACMMRLLIAAPMLHAFAAMRADVAAIVTAPAFRCHCRHAIIRQLMRDARFFAADAADIDTTLIRQPDAAMITPISADAAAISVSRYAAATLRRYWPPRH